MISIRQSNRTNERIRIWILIRMNSQLLITFPIHRLPVIDGQPFD